MSIRIPDLAIIRAKVSFRGKKKTHIEKNLASVKSTLKYKYAMPHLVYITLWLSMAIIFPRKGLLSYILSASLEEDQKTLPRLLFLKNKIILIPKRHLFLGWQILLPYKYFELRKSI